MSTVSRDVLIALDLATLAGWAVFRLDGQLLESGVWDLTPPPGSRPGKRWALYRVALARLLARYKGRVAAIALERPIAFGGQVNAIEVLFGQATLVELEAHRQDLPTIKVSPGTLKLFVAGHGRATKAQVMKGVIEATGPLTVERGGSNKTARDRRDKMRTDESDARAVGLTALAKHDVERLRLGEVVAR